MKPSEDLFLLIKSLTKTEKRYFKRFCKLYSTNKKNNYLKLFDAIDKQKVYDEKKIKDKFRNEKFAKQLSVAKSYLSKILLRSLAVLESNRDGYYSRRESIVECEILISKSLYKQSWKKSQLLKQQAYKFNNYILVLELIGNEKILITQLNTLKDQDRKLKQIILEEETVLKEIINIRKILNLHREVMTILNKTGMPVRNEMEISLVKDILRKLNNFPIDGNLSYRAKTILLHAKQSITLSICEYDKAYKYGLCLLKTLYKYDYLSSHDPKNVYGTLHNLVFISLNNNDRISTRKHFIELKKYYSKLSKISSKSVFENIFLNFLKLQLIMNNRFGDTDKNTILVNKFYEYSVNHKKIMNSPDFFEILVEMAITEIINENWENSLISINNILKSKTNRLKTKSILMLKLYFIISHYELKNFDNFESGVTSFCKFLQKNSNSGVLETLILNCFKKIVKAPNETVVIETLKIFKQNLRFIDSSPFENQLLKDFFLVEWIDSKILNKSIKEIISQRS